MNRQCLICYDIVKSGAFLRVGLNIYHKKCWDEADKELFLCNHCKGPVIDEGRMESFHMYHPKCWTAYCNKLEQEAYLAAFRKKYPWFKWDINQLTRQYHNELMAKPYITIPLIVSDHESRPDMYSYQMASPYAKSYGTEAALEKGIQSIAQHVANESAGFRAHPRIILVYRNQVEEVYDLTLPEKKVVIDPSLVERVNLAGVGEVERINLSGPYARALKAVPIPRQNPPAIVTRRTP